MKTSHNISVNYNYLWKAKKAIEKVQKRAEKNKWGTINYTVSKTYLKEFSDYDRYTKRTFKWKEPFVDITVEVPELKDPNWDVVGSILNKGFVDEDNIAVNLITPFEGHEDVTDTMKKLSTVTPKDIPCIHCDTKRYRKKWFIVQNKHDNKLATIGRSCAKDFFGYDVERILRMYSKCIEDLMKMEDMFGGYFEKPNANNVTVTELLEVTSSVINTREKEIRNGYFVYRDTLSSVIKSTALFIKSGYEHASQYGVEVPYPDYFNKEDHSYIHERDGDVFNELKKRITDYGNSLGASDFDDLKSYEKMFYMEWRNNSISLMGRSNFLTTLVFKYIDMLKEEKDTTPKVTKKHLGVVGNRETFVFYPTHKQSIDTHFSYYGETTNLIKGYVKDGEEVCPVVFFTTSQKVLDKLLDDEYNLITEPVTMTATVKQHNEDPKYGISTIVNRPKIN